MDSNNFNTLTFENHDTYIFYPAGILTSEHQVKLTPINPDNTDIVEYESFETTLFTNGIKKGVLKYNTFDTAEPIITQMYKREIELDEAINPHHVRDCIKSSPQKQHVTCCFALYQKHGCCKIY